MLWPLQSFTYCFRIEMRLIIIIVKTDSYVEVLIDQTFHSSIVQIPDHIYFEITDDCSPYLFYSIKKSWNITILIILHGFYRKYHDCFLFIAYYVKPKTVIYCHLSYDLYTQNMKISIYIYIFYYSKETKDIEES